jgi:hypothetical protein
MAVIKIRIDFDDDQYIGHVRIQLLEFIGVHGSIARAAKAMPMSYKRAWYICKRLRKDAPRRGFHIAILAHKFSSEGGELRRSPAPPAEAAIDQRIGKHGFEFIHQMLPFRGFLARCQMPLHGLTRPSPTSGPSRKLSKAA